MGQSCRAAGSRGSHHECRGCRPPLRPAGKTIRYYEEIGLIRPGHAGNGHRDYTGKDIHRLAFLRRARNLGFSIDVAAS